MCQFCVQHGEGQRWYFAAKNYSEDLLSDLRSRKIIQQLLGDLKALQRIPKQLLDYEKAPPFFQWFIRWQMRIKLRKEHHGQILPLEDVERIFRMSNSIVRLPCVCRKAATGEEKRFCYGISMGVDGGRFAEIVREISGNFLLGPDTKGLEPLTSEEAIRAFREHEQQGLYHSVWTFMTPFIGGICNCDRADCLAIKSAVSYGLPTVEKGHMLGAIDPERCVGCRNCMEVCQFGAIFYSAGRKKAGIDSKKCYGCGICRSMCEKQAITLVEPGLTATENVHAAQEITRCQ